jgi:branched-chain amino acid transport system substrate-binding protein
VRKALVGATILAIGLAACGSSGGKASTSPTTAASSSSPTTTAGSGSGGTSSGAPIKVALLDFETGTYALPGRHDSIELAINAINAQGGVDGHKIQYKAYDSGILPQQTVTAVLQAIQDHPTVIIGMPVSSGVQAAAAALKNSGIPTLQEASDTSTDLSALGVNNMFRVISTVQEEATGTAEYILSKHPKTVGIFDDSDLNGVQSMKLTRTYLQSHGVSNIVYREVAQNATDATEAALAMKGADVVASIGFPVIEATFVKDLYQNGITTQDVMSYAGPSIVAYGLAPKAALANDAMLDTCAPETLSTPVAKTYTQTYQAAHPTSNILGSGPDSYDAINLVAAAVKQDGGNLSPSALVSALSSVTYDGACGTYHSDSEHNMVHSVQILSGAGAGLATYTNMASS